MMINKTIIIFVVALCLTKQAWGFNIPMQAHSFNDLDYLSNLIDKGIDYFKMDVSMANYQSCLQHSVWAKSTPCLNSSQYVEEICCLAMRGDASSRPNFVYDFNTSSEFVALLEKKMPSIVQQKRRVLFAVNFQYSHSFSDHLSEQFLLQFAELLDKYPKNLLLGTGSDDFILEYDRICFGKGAP